MLWSYRKMMTRWWQGVYNKGQSGASPGWHWGLKRLSHLLNSLPADTTVLQYHAIQRSPRCQRKALRNTSDLNASYMLSDQNKKCALTPLVHNLASGKYSQPTGLQELSMNGNRGVLRQGCNEGMARRHSHLQLVHLVCAHTNTHTHVIPSPVLKRGNPTPGNQLGKTCHYGLIGDFLVAWETGCHGVSHHYHEGRRKRLIFPTRSENVFFLFFLSKPRLSISTPPLPFSSSPLLLHLGISFFITWIMRSHWQDCASQYLPGCRLSSVKLSGKRYSLADWSQLLHIQASRNRWGAINSSWWLNAKNCSSWSGHLRLAPKGKKSMFLLLQITNLVCGGGIFGVLGGVDSDEWNQWFGQMN